MKGSFKDVVNSEDVVLVDFFGTWCRPCQTLIPILKNVKKDLGNALKIIKIDIDKNEDLAMQYQVRSVPTMILFKNGKPKWRQSGVLRKKSIVNVIKTHSSAAV